MGIAARERAGVRGTLRRTGAVLVLAAGAVVLVAPAAAVADDGTGAEPAYSTQKLGVGPIAPVTGLKPGDGFGTTFAVKNTGAVPATKVLLTYGGSQGLAFAGRFSNCVYQTIPAQDEGPALLDAECGIEETLQPGVVYAPSAPLTFTTLGRALYETVGVAALPGDSTFPPGTRYGDGPVLHLVPLTTDPGGSYDHGVANTDVTVDSSADFALTGANLKGAVGRKVTANVTFANHGPGWVNNDVGKPIGNFEVTIPKGASVTKVPDSCLPDGTARYHCFTQLNWAGENTTVAYPFTLRIDKVVPGATGTIAFIKGQHRSGTLPFDHNPANNTAKIVLNAGAPGGGTGGASSAGGASGGASGGSSAGTSGVTASGGPQLAATGSDDALQLACVAAATLAVGGALALSAAARRR